MAFLMWLIAVQGLLIPLLSIGVQSEGNCYYPNGNLEPNDYPCGNLVLNACCPNSSYCMSNGLCVDDISMSYQRHTCTDKAWDSNFCPDMCHHSKFVPITSLEIDQSNAQ